ncbi:uncharacterized protein N0V89_010409 [Didymosphaeria variabile]|uniref:RING-type domain-containing protein n=1 Tax=Didymosphaeria variabile TaxID=1932322 RepID=A0A9W8XBK6_9PLEO|nr:uncharacterized protein N0V89_010409 [Didymosphaeria variabile]KAJ4346480.1 hypothetical protein N0V89_010409 [Didymosphaeria variabile]
MVSPSPLHSVMDSERLTSTVDVMDDSSTTSPRVKSMPANEEARSQVQRRLNRLTQLRALVDNVSEGLLHCPIERLSDCWEAMHPHTTFRSNTFVSAEQTRQELEQARSWLLQIISLQARHLPKGNMSHLLGHAIEKPANVRTDMERLYMALTGEEHGSVKESLKYAFSIVLHYRYAENHGYTLKRLQEQDDRRIRHEKKRGLPRRSEEAIRNRIFLKLQSVEVNNFTCAVPISFFANSTSEGSGACPVCRNEYLDFASFPAEDLISDYPVKIKYCGHIIGKSCLETWMETPLADPAKYPHRTCPLCRKAIEGVALPAPPQMIQQHVEENQKAIALADRIGMEDEECWDALLGLMSEEILLKELETEVKSRMLVVGKDVEYLKKAQMVLRSKLEELEEEKAVWGFGRIHQSWAQAKSEWANASVRQ